MLKEYMITSLWTDKVTGKTMNGLAEISRGVSKKGHPFEFLNTDRRETPIEGSNSIGTILTATTSYNVEDATVKASKQFTGKN